MLVILFIKERKKEDIVLEDIDLIARDVDIKKTIMICKHGCQSSPVVSKRWIVGDHKYDQVADISSAKLSGKVMRPTPEGGSGDTLHHIPFR